MCNCKYNHSIVVPTLPQVGKGIVGITKLALGQDIASPEMVKQRLDICRDCEFATRNQQRLNKSSKGLTSFSQCMKCSCLLVGKTKLTTETCPEKKW